MDATTKAFAVELVKIAAASSTQEKRRRGYLAAAAASLPFSLGKGVSDIPRGMVDKAVEGKIRSGTFPAFKNIAGRGLGRGAGFVAGAATAPLFLSGMRDVSYGKTKREKRRGYAKLTASGLLFGAGKGGIEASVEHGIRSPEARQAIRETMKSRGLVSAGAGLLTAAAVARMLRKPKGEEKPSALKRYGVPTAVGMAAGAGKGAFDELYSLWSRKNLAALKTPEGIRGVAAKAGGRAAAGALGAVALTELARRALQPKEKRASLIPPELSYPMYLGPRPGELYNQVHGWAKDADTEQLRKQFELSMAQGQGERTPTRRAVTYAMHDALQSRGESVPQMTMRDRVTRPDLVKNPTWVDGITLMAAVSLPYVFLDGINKNMPLEERDLVLMDSLDRMRAQSGIERVQAGKDFWGPTFTKAPEEASYHFGTMGDPGTRKVVERLESEGTTEGADLAAKVRAGHRRFVSLRPTSRPEALAHELGHATAGELRQKLMQPLARNAAAVGMATSIAVPLLALEGAQDRSFATPEELESRANFIVSAGKVALLLQAPVLAEEGLASLKGLGIMAVGGASKGRLLESLVHLGIPVATRALPAAMPFVAARMLRRKAKKGRERAAESLYR